MTHPDQLLLADRVAVITAGANGIGQGIALGLARVGAHVAIADIDAAAGEAAAAEIRALGRRALFVRTDVMDVDQVGRMAAEVDSVFGRADILVNNAGGVRHMRFLDMSERSLQRHVDLNLTSMFTVTRAIVPLMLRERRGGSILNITSSEGLRAGPLVAVYAACKAAMVSFTKSLALELAPDGVRVNAIAPDQCATPGSLTRRETATSEGHLPLGHPARDRYVPLGRPGTVEDCANAAVFLASDLAAYITGVTLPVDGGTIAAAGWNRTPGGAWTLYMPE